MQNALYYISGVKAGVPDGVFIAEIDYDKRSDPLLREIVGGFVYDILPFWKKDIKDVVVCGEPKTFCVYPVI